MPSATRHPRDQDDIREFQKVWRMLNRRERGRAMLQLLLSAVAMLLETLGIGLVIPAIMLMMQEDIGATYPATQPILDALGNPTHRELIIGGMALLVAVYCVKAVFLAFVAWRQNQFAFRIRSRLSEQLLTTYLRQPYAFFLQRNSAMLIRNAQAETQQLVTSWIRPCMILITEFLLIAGIVTLLLVVEPVGALLVAVVLGLAAFGFHRLMRKRITRWGEARRHHDGMRLLHMQQAIGSVKDIKVLGREKEFIARYRLHNVRATEAAQKHATISQLPRLWLELLAVAGLGILVSTMVIQGRDMATILPVLGVFGAAAFRLLPSINKVLSSIQSMRFVSTVVDTIYQELQMPAPPVFEHEGGSVPEFKGEIRAENVGFSYVGAVRAALHDLSFQVRKGESVGFVGPSGSGKSTAVDVVLGVLTPSSGRITVDGEDIQQNLRGWQDQIGYVPQSIYLTDAPLVHNVAFGVAPERVDRAAVDRAIRAAQLDEFVAGLPEGLNTVVGERGIRLSGGQRQRIGIARALYHDPAVLILDEATSALDGETERGVMQAVEALHGSKTILIVAHRLSTVEHCDRIIRLDQGRLVDEGPPQLLLAAQTSAQAEPVRLRGTDDQEA